jgi:hypothetical protein
MQTSELAVNELTAFFLKTLTLFDTLVMRKVVFLERKNFL